jgi:hypothetical protein
MHDAFEQFGAFAQDAADNKALLPVRADEYTYDWYRQNYADISRTSSPARVKRLASRTI